MNSSPVMPVAHNLRSSLALWMGGSVVLFVLLGSLGLLFLFQINLDRAAREAFEGLARANVSFLERTKLPHSGKMAAQLGAVIGATVFFYQPKTGELVGRPGEALDPMALQTPADGRVNIMSDGSWMVGLSTDSQTKVIFLRPASARVLALDRMDTWLALGVFWGLSLALGWGLARRVTLPLKALAKSLPQVGMDGDLPDLPVSRRDEIGQLAETLTRTHDTLRRERERRRNAERHALLGRMATSLAHEVRNPVSAIRLHAQLMEHAAPDEAAVSRGLIASEAARIEELVAQWLGYAKPAPPVLAAVDVAGEVWQAVCMMAPQARHAGVLLDGPADAPAMVVPADPLRLRQVLANLLRNAIQAMPSGGRVKISLEDAGFLVAVVVEDEGRGFSTTALARLGEPFYSEKEGGMGLGLASARDICEAHGGGLVAENRTSGGARVRVEFSKHPPNPANDLHSNS
jgi:signal transduction histidine kinase